MIELLMLKLCFDEGQLEQYLNDHNNGVSTYIYASYDEETETNEGSSRSCWYVSVEPW